jgi:hypothetical protein
VALEDLSLGQLYLGWTLVFSIVFGWVALVKAPNDLLSIVQYLAAAGGVSAVTAAWFAVPMWLIIRLAS